MKTNLTQNILSPIFGRRKAQHREYVANRVWELHEEISRISMNADRPHMNPRYRNKYNVEKLIVNDIRSKLWYLRKYQRYYKVLIT